MIKTTTITASLGALVMVSVIGSTSLCFRYVRSLNAVLTLQPEALRLQGQVGLIDRNRNIMRAMVADAVEYSKRNPAIDPILLKFDVKPKPSAPAPAKPAAR